MNNEPAIERSEPVYEPPLIEAVLTPEELTREILYAGDLPSIGTDNVQT